MIRIECKCLFDITATGVTGHFRESVLPFIDKSNTKINSEGAWNNSRNSQRNLETLLQLFSLRTQVSTFTTPNKIDDVWYFDVTVEAESALATFDDPLGILKNDSIGVPIILGLSEKNVKFPELVLTGDDQNIWFTPFLINTI